MFNDTVIIETIYTSGNDIYLPLLIDLLISNNFSSKYDIFLCSRVFKIVGVVFSKLSESGFQNCRSRVFKIVGVGFSKLSESGFQNCRSRVFKIVGVGFSKLSESGFQNCRSRVFKIVGVGFSKLSESGFQNCRSRVFKIVGVGFSKLSESGFQNCRSRVFKISDVKKTVFFRSCFLCKINKCFFFFKTVFYRFFCFFEIWHKYQYTSWNNASVGLI